MLGQAAGLLAPAATMLAAVMTASNLGARVTGWGFVVFSIGSTAWCLVAVTSDQANLLWTNTFLILVNLIGVWRWLGRRARFNKGAEAAAEASWHDPLPTITALSKIVGAPVLGPDDEQVGKVVDVMLACDRQCVFYFVITDGALGGVGESLYGIGAQEAAIEECALKVRITTSELARREPLEKDNWPAALSCRQVGQGC